MGMDWTLREGYCWAEDKEHCEEYGRMLSADASKVSMKAKKRGLPQVSTKLSFKHSLFSWEHWALAIITAKFKLLMRSMTNMLLARWELITLGRSVLWFIVAVVDWDIKLRRIRLWLWRRQCFVTTSL
jgi:hypothetical protein